MKPEGKLLKNCFNVSLPLIGERIVMGCGYVVFSALVAGLGTLSVAAHSIALTIEQAFMCQDMVFKLQLVHLLEMLWEKKRRIRIRIGCTFRTYCGCFYYDSNGIGLLRSRSDYTFLYEG